MAEIAPNASGEMMATKYESTASMSSEAYDLLDCFADEIGDLVFSIASQIAEKRITASGGSPVIGVDDMKTAVEMLTRAVKKAQEAGEFPEDKLNEFTGMLDCFKNSSGE